MNNKLNIEEIQFLIPDYITGSLSEHDKQLVESTLNESAELKAFYSDMKGALDFVSTVKYEEPSPQYWNNLLPRIHEKIDARASRGFSWEKIAALWKVAIPVAAVVLIAVVYLLVKNPSEQQFSDKNVITNSQNNTPKDNTEKKKQEITQPEKTQELANNTNQKSVQETKQVKRVSKSKEKAQSDNNIAQVKNNSGNNTDENSVISPEEINDNNQLASLNVDETTVFSAAGSETNIDEETQSDINNLNDSEKDKLLEELTKSNL